MNRRRYLLANTEDFLGIAVGNDKKVPVKMHCRLRLAGCAGRSAQQRDIVPAGLNGVKVTALPKADSSEFGVVIGRAVKADSLLKEFAGLAQITSSSMSLVSKSASAIWLCRRSC